MRVRQNSTHTHRHARSTCDFALLAAGGFVCEEASTKANHHCIALLLPQRDDDDATAASHVVACGTAESICSLKFIANRILSKMVGTLSAVLAWLRARLRVFARESSRNYLVFALPHCAPWRRRMYHNLLLKMEIRVTVYTHTHAHSHC